MFDDINQYCWNQQSTANISITTANSSSNNSSSINTSSPQQIIGNSDGQVVFLFVTKDDDFFGELK
jgi:hypothetical protein